MEDLANGLSELKNEAMELVICVTHRSIFYSYQNGAFCHLIPYEKIHFYAFSYLLHLFLVLV